jgi:AraC-like DNA-binding protein
MTLQTRRKKPADAPWDVYKKGFSFYRGDEHSVSSRPQRQTEIGVGFLFGGASELTFGGRVEKICEKQLHLIWGTVPHQTTWLAPRTSFGVVSIPLSWFVSWNLPGEFVQRVLSGEFIREPNPSSRTATDELLMLQWERDLAPGHSETSQKVALMEVEARLMRLAEAVLSAKSAHSAEPLTRPSPMNPNVSGDSIDRMTSYIAAHYQEPIGVNDIAKAAGLNPAYAMRLFRKLWGTTMGSFLLQHRLWHAQRLLVSTPMKIFEVAEESGFGSTAQFHELFRRNFHQTPANYRNHH